MKAPAKRCQWCGNKITTDNIRAIYCSKSCRQKKSLSIKKKAESNLNGFIEQQTPDNEEPQEEHLPPPPNEPQPTYNYPVQPASPKSRGIDAELFAQENWMDTLNSYSNPDASTPFEAQTAPPPFEQQPAKPFKRPPYTLSADQQMAYDYQEQQALLKAIFSAPAPEQQPKPEKPQTAPYKPTEKTNPLPVFSEPPPEVVEPVYHSSWGQIYTPKAKEIDENRMKAEKILFNLNNDAKIFNQLHQQLSLRQSRYVKRWTVQTGYPLPETELIKRMKSFAELCKTGCEGVGIIVEYAENNEQQNRDQLRMTIEKLETLVFAIEKAERVIKKMNDLLNSPNASYWGDTKTLTNKKQYETYLQDYNNWQLRKAAFEIKAKKLLETPAPPAQPIPPAQSSTGKPVAPDTKDWRAFYEANKHTTNPKSNNPPQAGQTEKPNQKSPENKPASGQPVQPVKPAQSDTRSKRRKAEKGEIISSLDVDKYAEDVYDFQGRYGRFIGQPPIGFEIVVHGLPGQGKSFFCYMFAHYLASNWGRVLYVASEEGFSQTTALKLRETKHPNLDLSNSGDVETIFQTVKKDQYKFIFFDSLKHLKINYELYLELRRFYETESFVSVQQSTKGKEMAGEQSLKHEIDVEIIVEDGYAITGKNRAMNGRTGRVFDVFPEDNRSYSEPDVEVI
jgi:hypothetical protein